MGTQSQYRPFTENEASEFKSMYNDNVNIDRLAKHFHIGTETLYRRMYDMGIERRKKFKAEPAYLSQECDKDISISTSVRLCGNCRKWKSYGVREGLYKFGHCAKYNKRTERCDICGQ